MKKKNLIILLIIPFIISLLGVITINVSINTFYGDITAIKWDYDEIEAFQLSGDKKYLLEATALNSSNAPLDKGNTLMWSCENKDEEDLDPIAEIVIENSKFYLKTLRAGEVIITCSNLKGNIIRKMTAIIYIDGVVIVKPEISNSQNNIDSTIYYGEYDLENNKKVNASFKFDITCIPEQLMDSVTVEYSNNLVVNLDKRLVTIMKEGDAYFEVKVRGNSGVTNGSYKFDVVDEGVNVYTYDDLLACTNKSEEGEKVVLRKSFVSLDEYKDNNGKNIELFGNIKKDNTFDFSEDIYEFETTYNQEYIKQWNTFVSSDKRYSSVSNLVKAGLRVQKDFYGNGFTINMHNLTYPSTTIETTVNGVVMSVPYLADKDLFRGPLPFYTLGDPNGLPLVSAYGQDNVGLYVDGDNITINDLDLKSAELKGSLSFLETVGTTLEAHGNNITIKNTRLSNGKNVLRCFSTNNFVLDNSLLSNSMNFLLEAGSNEYMSYDESKRYTFIDSTGKTKESNLSEYLNTKGQYGDTDLNNYLQGSFTDQEAMRSSLESIQNALNGGTSLEGLYKGDITIKDTFFYNSGIASIAFSTLFNGPFLYSAFPSFIMDTFTSLTGEDNSLIPYTPLKVGGTSYPIKVTLEGKTRFYDYKDSENIDITGLIKENISTIIKEVAGKDTEISIDTIFPVKPLLVNTARNNGDTYNSEGKEYINIPFAFYGGGLNLSTIDISNLENQEHLGDIFEIDFMGEFLTPGSASMYDLMSKAVTIVTGYEPFKFGCMKGDGYLFNESPSVQELIKNASK